MSSKPWQAEFDINLSLAQQLIESQFPELAPAGCEKLGEGWDNLAVLVNQQIVFRFPKRSLAVDLMNLECEFFAKSTHALPLPTPKPVFIGKPTPAYPYPFAGYPMLPGTTADQAHLTHEERCHLAKPLAQFLKALHSLSIQIPTDPIGRLDVPNRWPKVYANLQRIEELKLFKDTKILFEVLNSLKQVRSTPGNLVVCHGDLYSKHLLVDTERQLCGVIDWGDVHLGNPAVDLAIVFSFLSREARAHFWETYGAVDFVTQELAKFRALFSSTTLVIYAHDIGDTDLLEEALESLNFFLKQPILLEPYHPDWPIKFEQECRQIKSIWGDTLLEIHHFGSTSVPGLDAKPIIDIMIVLPNIELADQHTSELAKLGYEPRGAYVHAKHRVFNKPDFHLHVFEPGDPEIALNLCFRDHLRSQAQDREYYSRLKNMTLKENSLDAQNYRDSKDLLIKLIKYSPTDPKEISYKERMLELLKSTPHCFERSSLKAHFTASAWLLNKTGDKALLMHHMKLDRWFQLGGHADGERNLLRAAIKEAQEESGIEHIIALDSNIFDLDIHPLPAMSEQEPPHEHFDVRFLLQVASDEPVKQNRESKELRWIGKNRAELPTDNESVVRMFEKWVRQITIDK